MNNKEIHYFIKENLDLIYNYINTEILQDVGIMNFDYFTKNIQGFIDEQNIIQVDDDLNSKVNLVPYLFFTTLGNEGRIDYTELRLETINFNKIDKEASVYYNYVQFSLDDNFLSIKLMQTKIGGMPIDKDIIKFTKQIPILENGLQQFIDKMKS